MCQLWRVEKNEKEKLTKVLPKKNMSVFKNSNKVTVTGKITKLHKNKSKNSYKNYLFLQLQNEKGKQIPAFVFNFPSK
jgi:DNA polymerase III alpha subunit